MGTWTREIYLCYLWLFLCSRVTFIFFASGCFSASCHERCIFKLKTIFKSRPVVFSDGFCWENVWQLQVSTVLLMCSLACLCVRKAVEWCCVVKVLQQSSSDPHQHAVFYSAGHCFRSISAQIASLAVGGGLGWMWIRYRADRAGVFCAALSPSLLRQTQFHALVICS